jgi:predicted nucleic acid-binding protein
MLVVSNTSPISNLAIIGRLDVLKRRYGSMQIPPTVAKELDALTHSSASKSVKAAISEGWIVISDNPTPETSELAELDLGEAAAIELACQLKADLLLIDKRKGREAARARGLAVAGLLGELLYAKRQSWIPNLRAELSRLRTDARFFISSEIEKMFLMESGEE